MVQKPRGKTPPPSSPKRSERPPHTRKSLGRGLAALIPDDDMVFLSRIARGDETIQLQKPAASAHKSAIQRVDNDDDAPLQPDSPPPIADPDAAHTVQGVSVKAVVDAPVSRPTDSKGATPTVQWISTTAIEANPYQPRRTFAVQEMEDLVRSIREHGVLQPIIVRPLSESSPTGTAFQLVAGERRWRAAQEAKLTSVPAIVRDVNDQQALELALIENIQRHDISPLDAAHAYQRLASEFRLSQEKVAERVGKSRSSVANTLRLLDLPREMQQALEEGKVTEGHGRALLAAPNEGARRALFRRILRDGLSVREAERLSKSIGVSTELKNDKTSVNDSAPGILTAPEIKDIEQRLQRIVGTRLHIKTKKQGGQIVLEYFSLEELDRLVALFTNAAK